MASRTEEIADAVVDEINDWVWPVGTVTASRKTITEYTSLERESVCVSVMVFDTESTLFNRGKVLRTVTLDIAYQKNCKPTDTDTISQLDDFGEDLADYWLFKEDDGARILAGEPTVKVQSVERSPTYSPEDLKKGIYFSRILLILIEATNV